MNLTWEEVVLGLCFVLAVGMLAFLIPSLVYLVVSALW